MQGNSASGTAGLIPRVCRVRRSQQVQDEADFGFLRLAGLLLNDAERMGSLKNTRAQNIISVTVVGIIVALSTLYGVSALFPDLLR